MPQKNLILIVPEVISENFLMTNSNNKYFSLPWCLCVFVVFIYLCFPSAVGAGSSDGPYSNTSTPQDPLSRFTPEQRKKLLAGEPVFDFKVISVPGQGDKGQARASIIVDAPIKTCFKIFSELDKQYLYFPRKTKSNVVGKEDGRTILYNEFDFYIYKVAFTSRYTIDPVKYRFDFAMDKSFPHNIKETKGYFVFEVVDDKRTLFTYASTDVDSGIKIPAFIQEYLFSRDLPAEAVNVKKRIESGGKWSKQ